MAVLFLVTVTAVAVSANPTHKYYPQTSVGASEKITDKSTETTSTPAIYGNKVVWSDSALAKTKMFFD